MTTFLFEKAKYMTDAEGNWLLLKAPSLRQIIQFCINFKDGKKYQADLKEHHEKRSLDANAYAWVLIDKLSVALGITQEEIYREFVREIGGNSYLQLVHKNDVEKAQRIWKKNGLAWTSEELGTSNDRPDYVWVKYYYGSSVFDSAQMARFIDQIIEVCKDQGIETLPPEQVKALKERWQ